MTGTTTVKPENIVCLDTVALAVLGEITVAPHNGFAVVIAFRRIQGALFAMRRLPNLGASDVGGFNQTIAAQFQVRLRRVGPRINFLRKASPHAPQASRPNGD